MKKLLLALAALAGLTTLSSPPARAQNASVVTTCGTLNLPTGYANYPLTQDTTGTLCATGGGGGGGGAVTVADGADVNAGSTTDAAATVGATGTMSAKLRLMTTQLNNISNVQTGGLAKTQIVDGAGNVIASTSNNLNVQCANCSGSGASATDAASFTAGSSVFAPSGVFFQTTATANPLTNGQQGMLQGTANRAAFVNLRNASGAEIGVAAAPVQVSLANTAANATAVKVDGSAVTQPVSGTFWQATQPVSGTVAATQSGTWNIGSVTTLPALTAGSAIIGRVGIDQTTPGTTNLVSAGQNGTWNITNVSGTVSLPTGASTAANQTSTQGSVSGGTAATVSTLIGGQYLASAPTLTNAQQAAAQLDVNGNLKVNVVSGSGANPAASATGSAVPASGGYTAVNVGGTLRGATAVNPTGSVYAIQTDHASIVGTTVSVGNGASGAGVQRVTIANDSTGVVNGPGTNGSAVTGGGVRAQGSDGTNARDLATSTTGVLDSPRAGTSNRVVTKTSIASNTSTQVCPTATAPISTELYFTVGGVGISLSGGTLTSATIGTTAGTQPDLAFGTANTLYTFPVPPTNAITAYGAAGIVVCIQNLRQ